MTVKVEGLGALGGDNLNGYAGTLTVRISGVGSSRGFAVKVPINQAPSLDAARIRALQGAEGVVNILLAQVKAELARLLL